MNKILAVLYSVGLACLLALFPLPALAGISDSEWCDPPDSVPFTHNSITYDYIIQVKGWDLKQYFFYGQSANPKPSTWSFEHDPYHGINLFGTHPFRLSTLSASSDCSGSYSDSYATIEDETYGNLIIYDGESYFFSGAPGNINNIIRSNIPLSGTVGVASAAFGGGGERPYFVQSPVDGELEVVTASNQCSNTKWCFNQHGTGVHTTTGGIGSSDDSLAWDINLNFPNANTDLDLPVYAVEAGEVTLAYAGATNAGGTYGQILIKHTHNGHDWWSGYLHLTGITKATEDSVTKGELIGYISYTGLGGGSSIAHLHLIVYKGTNSSGNLDGFNVGFTEK